MLLYWGAQWCPPCKQLKSAVFNRPDFIEKSKLFVAVYLDGDLPDAQKFGDEFRVTGYPTVVVFKPDRTEITRIAGNMDLSLYAGVLDNALGDVRPVKDVIEIAVKGEAPHGAPTIAAGSRITRSGSKMTACSRRRSCRPLSKMPRASVPRISPRSARGCTFAPPSRPTSQQKDVINNGGKADKALTVSIVRVNEILPRSQSRWRTRMRCAACAREFFLAARQTLPQLAPTLRERWMAIADAATANQEFAPADQLAAQLMKITAAKAYAADAKVPTDVRSVALATATKMLAVKQEPYVRAGVVNSAINIYIALDDWERARDLLALEATTSNTPHYYLGDLADVEEHLGNKQRSVELLAEAYAKAKGPASRFQWGYQLPRRTAAPDAR